MIRLSGFTNQEKIRYTLQKSGRIVSSATFAVYLWLYNWSGRNPVARIQAGRISFWPLPLLSRSRVKIHLTASGPEQAGQSAGFRVDVLLFTLAVFSFFSRYRPPTPSWSRESF